MCFFRKKKKCIEYTPVSVCDHKYQDFPWYKDSLFVYDKDGDCGTQHLKIFKPYVCIHCKERKDVLIYECKRVRLSLEDAEFWIDNITETFKDKLKRRPIVEEMIYDMQLVDREYLRIAAELYHPEIRTIIAKENSNETKAESQP